MEHDLAAQRDLLVAVAHARQDHADRLRAQLAHDVDLSRRGVRAQQHARRGRVEGVPHVAGRVVRRHVEQAEVRLVVLDLGAAIDLEAHVGEDRVDRSQGLRRGMQPAARRGSARQGHVQHSPRRGCAPGRVPSRGQGASYALVRRSLTWLARWPYALRSAGGSLPTLSAQRHLALFAEVARVPGAQPGLVGAGVQFGPGAVDSSACKIVSWVKFLQPGRAFHRDRCTRGSRRTGCKPVLTVHYLDPAGRLARASSTIFVNVSGSLIARLASVLRSSSTAARCRPAMSWL